MLYDKRILECRTSPHHQLKETYKKSRPRCYEKHHTKSQKERGKSPGNSTVLCLCLLLLSSPKGRKSRQMQINARKARRENRHKGLPSPQSKKETPDTIPSRNIPSRLAKSYVTSFSKCAIKLDATYPVESLARSPLVSFSALAQRHLKSRLPQFLVAAFSPLLCPMEPNRPPPSLLTNT